MTTQSYLLGFMIVYPAIDLKDFKVVRLTQGKADQATVYYEDPAIPAMHWKDAGADWIHVVDLDGAFTGSPRNGASIQRIVACGLKVQLGGGIRSRETAYAALKSGASRIVLGTKAVLDHDFLKSLIDEFGDRIAAGIDARDGMVAIKGWVETTSKRVQDLVAELSSIGLKTIIYTDISRDGMLTGPNFAAYEELLEKSSLNIIASGGVATLEDVKRYQFMAETHKNLDGVIIGKALYEKTFTLKEALEV